MTPEEFVDGVRAYVLDDAVAGVISVIENPPRGRPEDRFEELSRWFKGLSDEDRHMVEHLMGHAAHSGVFGMLVTLDGSRKIVDGPPGYFELSFVRGTERDILCGPAGAVLHELL